MVSKQYFCNYCLRSFRDTVQDRRKHRQSVAHRQAKSAFQLQCLQKLTKRFGYENLQMIFSVEDLNKLKEILNKQNSCKYHFSSISNKSNISECNYGLFCKNSHLLNDEQIEEHKNRFIEILSCKWTKDKLKTFYINNQPSLSKRQLKKELFLNIWLEKRFGFNNQSDLIVMLLNTNSN